MTAPVVPGELSPAEHDAVRLVYFEGRTLADAARAMSTDSAAIGRDLARAFRRIAAEVLAVEAPLRAAVPAVEA